MIINTAHIQLTCLLVDSTKSQIINWVNVEDLKAFLRRHDQSLNSVQSIHEYLVYLQKDKFIFDCAYTYLVVHDDVLFFFAKGKYSFTYRLDKLELGNPTIEWKRVRVPTNILLRIRNAISIISTYTNDDMCDNLLATISSDILV